VRAPHRRAAAEDGRRSPPSFRLFRHSTPTPYNQVRQKRSPCLPLNRILVLAEEVLNLQRLFKLLEEQFNLPPCLVEFRNR
jgi:hypothetical protein